MARAARPGQQQLHSRQLVSDTTRASWHWPRPCPTGPSYVQAEPLAGRRPLLCWVRVTVHSVYQYYLFLLEYYTLFHNITHYY